MRKLIGCLVGLLSVSSAVAVPHAWTVDQFIQIGSQQKNHLNYMVGKQIKASTGYIHFVTEYSKYSGTKIGFCTVWRISPDYFLTAGHCFADRDGYLDEERMNAKLYFQNKEYLVDRTKIFVHKGFAGGVNADDLTLFSVKKPQTLPPQTPILVAGESTIISHNHPLLLAGAGETAYDRKDMGTIRLKWFNATAVNNNNSKLDLATRNGLYLGKVDGIACQGDSGGPVFQIEYDAEGRPCLVLVGIVSSGTTKYISCEQLDRTVHIVDMRKYHPWLRQHLTVVP